MKTVIHLMIKPLPEPFPKRIKYHKKFVDWLIDQYQGHSHEGGIWFTSAVDRKRTHADLKAKGIRLWFVDGTYVKFTEAYLMIRPNEGELLEHALIYSMDFLGAPDMVGLWDWCMDNKEGLWI